MYSYADIQRAYDAEMKENMEWSVYLLPDPIPYFNYFIPVTVRLRGDNLMEYLANMCHVYDGDLSQIDLHKRLFSLRDRFLHVELSVYMSNVNEIVKAHADGETLFKPNAVARSIKNPYYRYPTDSPNDERRTIRRDHRRELKELLGNPELEDQIILFLEDYDYNNGLLSREKIKKELGCSRFHLDRCLRNNKILADMFDIVRHESRSPSYKRRK